MSPVKVLITVTVPFSEPRHITPSSFQLIQVVALERLSESFWDKATDPLFQTLSTPPADNEAMAPPGLYTTL